MIWKPMLATGALALTMAGFAGTAHAKTLAAPTANCAIGSLGNPAVTDMNVTGSGYTKGHTYYARVAQPDGGGVAQVLYQSFQGEFFFQDTNLNGNLPPGTYSVAIYQSVAAFNSHKAALASCSAVAP